MKLWEDLKARLMGFRSAPRIIAVKPTFDAGVDAGLKDSTDGLHPALSIPYDRKSNLTFNLIRQHADSLESEDRERFLKAYAEAVGVYDDFDAKAFMERNADRFVDQKILEQVDRVEQQLRESQDQPAVIVIDSHTPVDTDRIVDLVRSNRPVTIVPVCSRATLMAAASRVSAAAQTKILIDAVPTLSVNNLEKMIERMEVCVEPVRTHERPWVEMNDRFHRKRKRARPGRKYGKS